MLTVNLDPAIEKRLEELASRTGRSKEVCVQQAILEHLEDLEDVLIGEERVRHPGKTFSAEQVKDELDLQD
jgi:RHH-type rel operon transcriptional repressor/antitoxin RelB